MTPEQWRIVIPNSFKKMKLANVTVVGGEPMSRKDVVQVFSEEMRYRMNVVTNGMFPLTYSGLLAELFPLEKVIRN